MQAAKLSLYTPFSISEEHAGMELKEAMEMYSTSSTASLEILAKEEILSLISREPNGELVQGELLLFFDCLMQDHIKTVH